MGTSLAASKVSHRYTFDAFGWRGWRRIIANALCRGLRSIGLARSEAVDIVARLIPQRRIWSDVIDNLVVNTGLDDYLDKYYKGSSYTASHFVLLTDGTPTVAAADTMASHAGWVEVTAYDEANRPAYTPGTVASQSVDNSASKAVFTIDTNSTTVGGAGLTTNNTKGGSTGTLVGAGAFTGGDKSLDDNDTLNVTITATMAAA